jgi:4'-phosphopantetheinyl transferase
LNLTNHEIHVWCSSPGETNDPDGSATCDPILDDEERDRMSKILYPENRCLFRESRVLLRRSLSRYSEMPPKGWRFVKDAHGKPRVDPDRHDSALSFSLAHTKGLAAVAVTQGNDIGVDVEKLDRPVDAAGLTRRFFSPEEVAYLQKLPPERFRELFPLYWTLKESYIKARGLGLSLPLDSFSFRLAGKMPHRIEFSGNDPDGLKEWRFALFKPLPGYVAAVGIFSTRSAPVRIRCFQMFLSEEMSHLGIEILGFSPGMEIDEDDKETRFNG